MPQTSTNLLDLPALEIDFHIFSRGTGQQKDTQLVSPHFVKSAGLDIFCEWKLVKPSLIGR